MRLDAVCQCYPMCAIVSYLDSSRFMMIYVDSSFVLVFLSSAEQWEMLMMVGLDFYGFHKRSNQAECPQVV